MKLQRCSSDAKHAKAPQSSLAPGPARTHSLQDRPGHTRSRTGPDTAAEAGHICNHELFASSHFALPLVSTVSVAVLLIGVFVFSQMNVSSPNSTCDMFAAKIILSIGCLRYVLLLPVFLAVALVGHEKWKKQRSVSHSDAINYHMMALEMNRIVGFCLYSYGTYTETDSAKDIATYMISLASSGQLLFHCLACGERHLAAVNPITYLRFKKRGGVTIRNISVVITWLCASAQVMVRAFVSSVSYMVVACLMAFCASMLVTFWSVSVLRVLTGPRPGERGGDARRVDQSKRSAFNSMLAILGTLLVRFVVLVIHYALSLSRSPAVDKCVLMVLVPWFELPSSLVLPLLFLHREGKLRLWR